GGNVRRRPVVSAAQSKWEGERVAVVEEKHQPFIRQDGKDKVTGHGRYTADLARTGMLHARFRYSDHAHARVVRIDTERARALPGVFAVLTQDDVPTSATAGSWRTAPSLPAMS